MKRAELEAMELTKEQIDTIMAKNGADIENAKATAQKDVDGLTEQIKERDKQLEELKKAAGDNESLTEQIAKLQAENKTATEAHKAEVSQLKLDYAVERALTNAGAKNVKAVRALLDLDGVKIDGDGNVKGLDEQIKALTDAEDSKFLFKTKQDEGARLQGFTPAASGDVKPDVQKDVSKMTYSEMVAYKAANPDADLGF